MLGAVRCASNHLTDFKASVQSVQLRPISVQQLTALKPRDLVTKLRVLASLIFGMFAVMLLWSGTMYVHDVEGRKEMLRELMAPAGADGEPGCGFVQVDGGAWLWELPPVVADESGHLSGAQRSPWSILSSSFSVDAVADSL